ncbi:MAG: radical SAM protein [Christensenellales bacterium]|jgi:pyruvate formate-lyase activating enzyme-like uncharacterized protein
MKIPKKDAAIWFEFFASLPEEEGLSVRQMEIVYAALAQIERAVEARREKEIAKLKTAHTLNGRTLFCGNEKKFPRGCVSCLMGTGLNAVRKTNRCNLHCAFCYDYGRLDDQPPVGAGLWEIGGTKLYAQDLPLLLSIHKKPSGIAYVYLEPFMEIEEYIPVIRIFHEHGVYQHMYTNGTLATEDNLQALGEAGLDELRFNLGATNASDRVIEAMGTAKRFIPRVGIETPMTPAFDHAFHQKKGAILSSGIDFINCAELHLNPNNIDNYAGEPMYMTRLGYLSPVWSCDLAIRLLQECDEESWDIAVHDCSNRTKLARDLNLRAKEGGWFGASAYACEFDTIPYAYFLPILQDESFAFLEEEPLPEGYRVGDMTF